MRSKRMDGRRPASPENGRFVGVQAVLEFAQGRAYNQSCTWFVRTQVLAVPTLDGRTFPHSMCHRPRATFVFFT